MDRAIKKALEAQQDHDTRDCLDENTVAAYLEMRLSEAEIRSVESHASICAVCRETIGLALRLAEREEAPGAASPAAASRRTVLFHFSLPVSMAVMMVLAVVAGFLLYRVVRESKPPQSAELHLPPPRAEGISAAKTAAPAVQTEKAGRDRVLNSQAKAHIPAESADTRRSAAVKPPQQEQASEAVTPPSAAVNPPQQEPALEASAPAPSAPEPGPENRLVAAEGKPPIATAAYQAGDIAKEAPQLGSARLAGSHQAAVARSQPVAVQAVITPQDAVLRLAGLDVSGRKRLPAKEIAGRTFYFYSGYWIDAQCAEHPSAEFEGIAPGSSSCDVLAKPFSKVRPAIIFWDSRNCILR